MYSQHQPLLACAFLLLLGAAPWAKAVTSCPSTTHVTSTTSMGAILGRTDGSCTFNSYSGASGYNNLATTTSFPAHYRVLLLLPDDSSAGVTGANSGARIAFSPSSGTSRSNVTVTCPGATISNNGTAAPEIELTDGASCSLTATATLSTTTTYTATLSRTGNVYLVGSGSFAGDIFADSTPPTVEILHAPANLTNLEPFNVTFQFDEDVNDFVLGDIAVGNGSASNFQIIGDDEYTADITPDGAGDVTIDVNAAVATDDANNDNEAASQVVVTCGAGCGVAATIDATQSRIQNFIGKRMSLFAAHRPDLAGLLTGHGIGGGFNGFTGGPAGISFNGDKDLRQGNFSFNLQQFVNSTNQANQRDELTFSRASGTGAGPGVQKPLQSAYNFWIKGSWVNAEEDRGNIDEEIDFYVVHVGADYRYSKDTLIGVMGQFDRTEEKSTALGSETEGDGWMIGPYLVTRLTDTLVLDLHGSWGQSDNEINPLGTYWDDFDTERWQLAGNLTGSYDSGPWHISPSIGLVYFEETQEAYTDSNGFRIGEQTFDLGSLNFGPTVTYRIERPNGMVIRPLIGLKGIYDFNSPDITAVSGQAIGTDDFRAQLTVGLNVLTSGGSTLQATYTHDGIGVSDFESHTGQIIFSTPINRLTDGASLKGTYSLSGAGQFDNDDNDVSQGVNLSVNIPYD